MRFRQAKELIDKYLDGTANSQERSLLDRWYQDKSPKGIFPDPEELLQDEIRSLRKLDAYLSRPKRVLLWPRLVAAAVLLLLLLATYLISNRVKPANENQFLAHDVQPAKDAATLTLADGKKLVLKGGAPKLLAKQGQTRVSTTAAGELIYQQAADQSTRGQDFNTLATPRGGQFQLVLSDGTHVWLNAASSLRYPAAFSAQNRTVELTGEAYFEVAHDSARPFRIISKGQRVDVLGTHFNIQAYQDESFIKTTLVQGSVRVTRLLDGQAEQISPGQALLFEGSRFAVSNADLREALSWKEGYFRFKDEKLESVMKQISRWYNVDIELLGDVGTIALTGKISRNKNISQVLKMLEQTGLAHFELTERRVLVRH
ncbi:FecR family protein [Pedobacter jeongneungensis]|uniref:FecR family protein n=1 Tax=Pedobacter jeongneungensis TaxID=947309 RepID=UPI0004691789|nr:FecR domain-containing protein [Pedobacter jeongneungensis]